MKVNIKKLSPTAKIPTKGTYASAGYDLYADVRSDDDDIGVITIYPHQTLMITTGISVEIPNGYFGGIFARSGLSTKKSLRPANCVGCIDSDYRGEVIIALHNDSNVQQEFSNHDRIAQLVIIPYLDVEFEEVDKISTTNRGEGGFGSTGKE